MSFLEIVPFQTLLNKYCSNKEFQVKVYYRPSILEKVQMISFEFPHCCECSVFEVYVMQ